MEIVTLFFLTIILTAFENQLVNFNARYLVKLLRQEPIYSIQTNIYSIQTNIYSKQKTFIPNKQTFISNKNQKKFFVSNNFEVLESRLNSTAEKVAIQIVFKI